MLSLTMSPPSPVMPSSPWQWLLFQVFEEVEAECKQVGRTFQKIRSYEGCERQDPCPLRTCCEVERTCYEVHDYDERRYRHLYGELKALEDVQILLEQLLVTRSRSREVLDDFAFSLRRMRESFTWCTGVASGAIREHLSQEGIWGCEGSACAYERYLPVFEWLFASPTERGASPMHAAYQKRFRKRPRPAALEIEHVRTLDAQLQTLRDQIALRKTRAEARSQRGPEEYGTWDALRNTREIWNGWFGNNLLRVLTRMQANMSNVQALLDYYIKQCHEACAAFGETQARYEAEAWDIYHWEISRSVPPTAEESRVYRERFTREEGPHSQEARIQVYQGYWDELARLLRENPN